MKEVTRKGPRAYDPILLYAPVTQAFGIFSPFVALHMECSLLCKIFGTKGRLFLPLKMYFLPLICTFLAFSSNHIPDAAVSLPHEK